MFRFDLLGYSNLMPTLSFFFSGLGLSHSVFLFVRIDFRVSSFKAKGELGQRNCTRSRQTAEEKRPRVAKIYIFHKTVHGRQ